MSHPAPDDEVAWRPWQDHWTFAAGVCYLNHGSFGPPPRPVLQAREYWSRELAANPMRFFIRELGERLRQVRERLGAFVGAKADNLALVDNATWGMNVVAASVPLQPGDEVLTTNHDYGAVFRIWEHACRRSGARLVIQPAALPIRSAEELISQVLAGLSLRTRLLVFSHITSPTAVIFPAEALTRAARARGVAVCIDGPHAPAQIAVELDRYDCDFYTASCHKWLSAPFGSGFLYVHPRQQPAVQTCLTSWGRALDGDPAGWRDELNWLGTRDPAAQLAIPAALDFLEEAGLDPFRQRTHFLASHARRRLAEVFDLPPLTPDDGWYGSMVAATLPPGEAPPLQEALWREHGIEVPIVPWQGERLVRVSCHLYTQRAEIDRLIEILWQLLRGTPGHG